MGATEAQTPNTPNTTKASMRPVRLEPSNEESGLKASVESAVLAGGLRVKLLDISSSGIILLVIWVLADPESVRQEPDHEGRNLPLFLL